MHMILYSQASRYLHAVQRREHEGASGPGEMSRLLRLQLCCLCRQAAHLPAGHRQSLRHGGTMTMRLQASGTDS